MGKGDIKSRRGKIWKGSYGVRRKRKKGHKAFAPVVAKAKPVAAPIEVSEEVKKAPKKVAPKKAAVKKEEGEVAPKKKAAPKKKKAE